MGFEVVIETSVSYSSNIVLKQIEKILRTKGPFFSMFWLI